MTASRPRAVTVSAFAKINLDLRVLGVRPDGYHELRTTFQSIALADTLTFAPSRGDLQIVCDDPACPAGEGNLVWRAAALAWSAARRRGTPKGVTVMLHKRVPMEAGLGGGSSDAAAALRAFARMWRVNVDLRRLAAELGADVPYFLEGGTALGLNRGDVLVPLDDISRAWVVLIVPEFGVKTKDAFRWWDDRAGRPFRGRRASANDLEPVVAKRYPVVSWLTRELRREGASVASLSGSGSAVFGLFPTRAAAQAAARAFGGRRVVLTRTLSRRECRRLAAK